MMSPRQLELSLRRQRLQLRCAEQRDALVRGAKRLAPAFAAADAVREGVDYLKAHPQWVAALVVVTLLWRPWGVLRWGRRGYLAWRGWRRIRGWLERVLPPAGREA